MKFWPMVSEKYTRKNVKVNISKFHNSIMYRAETGLQNAQLGLAYIIAVKFHENLTNGFLEIVFYKLV